MAVKPTDEFWNTSSSVSFNFDDDLDVDNFSGVPNELPPSETSSTLVNSHLETGIIINLNTLPIHSLLTKRNLDAVLDDVRTVSQTTPPSVQETVIKMFLGMPYSLSVYRSLTQKLELLDEAIASDDGNTILTVILFLNKTLEKSELYSQLSKRKVAFCQYSNYLMRESLLQELGNLYLKCQDFTDIIYLYYLEFEPDMSNEKIHSMLLRFLLDYQDTLNSVTKSKFHEYKNFIKWQLDNNTKSNTVTELLASLCKTQWEKNCDTTSFDKKITEFKVFVKMSDHQYEWIVVNVLSTFHMWKKLISLFIKPQWLSKRSTIVSVINTELLILTLHKHGAPKNILEEFLACVDDSEISLSLAKKLCCHKFVVNLYASRRNRSAIQMYKSEIPRDSEEYAFAETTLASNIRWKN